MNAEGLRGQSVATPGDRVAALARGRSRAARRSSVAPLWLAGVTLRLIGLALPVAVAWTLPLLAQAPADRPQLTFLLAFAAAGLTIIFET